MILNPCPEGKLPNPRKMKSQLNGVIVSYQSKTYYGSIHGYYKLISTACQPEAACLYKAISSRMCCNICARPI